MNALCPCGAGVSYEQHCKQIHTTRRATTAEGLMRARYSAHVLGDRDFLEDSWHPDTIPANLPPDADTLWTGLIIHRTERGGVLDADGVVEFTATFERDGVQQTLREVSRFGRVGTRWVYLDGLHHPSALDPAVSGASDQNSQS